MPTKPPVVQPTRQRHLEDAYLQRLEATVVGLDAALGRVALDETVFHPTGGGQPSDTGSIAGRRVLGARDEQGVIWHELEGSLPALGSLVVAEIDWEHRYQLMRTHTALHILCGVIWREYQTAVTGGNMEPLAARMDFEFDPLPEGFGARIEQSVNAEIAKDRPIEVLFMDRDGAAVDPALLRTKTNLVPSHVTKVRVVDIVGLDKQADGGTHVSSTKEVGTVRVVKTESKGKGNKRIRIAVI
jgi:misacylated tRNA(Ala) deacylase